MLDCTPELLIAQSANVTNQDVKETKPMLAFVSLLLLTLLLLCNRTAGGIRYAESYLEDNRKYINRDVLQLLNDLTSCKPSGLRICA